VIDIGSFYADSSRFAEACGWRPAISLREGLARTLTFYREHMAHYVSQEAGS
jgi:UDP-glucose 4-epimerase